jgi:hypothetical protein
MIEINLTIAGLGIGFSQACLDLQDYPHCQGCKKDVP